jgi:MFS family permease
MLSTKGVSRTVITLGWVSLLTDVSSEMVAAILPLFIVVQLGLTPLTYGIVESVYQAGSVLARLAGGYLGDRRRPKIIAAAGYGASAVCKVLLMFVTSLAGIMGVVALDRAGKGLRTAPRDAMIADATKPETMGRAFGVHRALDTFGALLGPIVAWLLLLIAMDDFTLVFFVSFCFALMGVVLILFLKPERVKDETKADSEQSIATTKVDFRAIRSFLRDPRMTAVLTITALLSITTIADGFLYLSLALQGAVQTQHFPLLFVATSLVYLLTAVPAGNLADRIGRARVFAVGYAFLLCAYFGAGIIGGMAGVVICVVALGLFYAATDGVLSALTAPILPSHVRSTGLSIVQATQAIGRAAGAIAFGVLWSTFGLTAAVWIYMLALVAAIAVVALLAGRLQIGDAVNV